MSEVLNQDITSVPEESRLQFLNEKAEQVSVLLREKYPESGGYIHAHSAFTPFEERKDIKGQAFGVRKGKYWGYHIALTPADFQIRNIKVELKDNLAFTETLLYISLAAGVFTSIAAVISVFVFGASEMRDYIIAGLSGILSGVILFFILKSLTKAKVQKNIDPDQVQKEKAALSEDISRIINSGV